MGAPLAAVNDVEVLERESKLSSELVDPGPEIALGKSFKLVEQWLDWWSQRRRFCRIRNDNGVMAHTEGGVNNLQGQLDEQPGPSVRSNGT